MDEISFESIVDKALSETWMADTLSTFLPRIFHSQHIFYSPLTVQR